MKKSRILMTIVLSILMMGQIACQKNNVEAEGEEEGERLKVDETYDKVRKGVRLILSHDEASASFKGTIENTSNELIKDVRVEVHLSNGNELGPTEKEDLAPGEKNDVSLLAEDQTFEWWSTHAEVGKGEHGSNHEGEGEHGGEHGGEHKGEHSEREGREHN